MHVPYVFCLTCLDLQKKHFIGNPPTKLTRPMIHIKCNKTLDINYSTTYHGVQKMIPLKETNYRKLVVIFYSQFQPIMVANIEPDRVMVGTCYKTLCRQTRISLIYPLS